MVKKKKEEPKEPVKSVFLYGFNLTNIVLFIFACIIFAIALIEPGRGLDIVATIVIIFVIGKIAFDSYHGIS